MKVETGDIIAYKEGGLFFLFELAQVMTDYTDGMTRLLLEAVPGSVIAVGKGRAGRAEAVRDAPKYLPYDCCRKATFNEIRYYDKNIGV